uniref:Uncharacterized protein n=1 Tax=Rhizophora mucronata TaxID=61149 RepID=A0A2P2NTP7_RHIMU
MYKFSLLFKHGFMAYPKKVDEKRKEQIVFGWINIIGSCRYSFWLLRM